MSTEPHGDGPQGRPEGEPTDTEPHGDGPQGRPEGEPTDTEPHGDGPQGRPEGDARPHPIVFWGGMAAGAAIVVYGLRGWSFWDSSIDVGTYLRWTVGLALFHDLIFGPAVGLIGYAMARLLPPPYRAPVQAGAIVAGVVTLFSIPFVRGWGRNSNTSALPRDYGQGLAVVLALVGATTLIGLVIAWYRQRTSTGSRA